MHSAKRITLLWKRDNEYKQSKKEGARSSGKQRGNSKTNSVRVMLVDGQSSGADNALHARVAVALFAELIVLSVEPMASLFCNFFFDFWFRAVRLFVIIRVIRKSDSHLSFVRFRKSLVWLQTE